MCVVLRSNMCLFFLIFFFFSSRRRHTRCSRDWSSDVCSSDLIQGKAPDGMDINRYYNFDWVNPSDAPDDMAVSAAEATMRKELEGLVAAPLIEPTAGPALLTGRAAAVFFHEVFGHRAEGHRQKDINEGQTFARKVGEQILPDFLSIVDDPTERRLGPTELLGYYKFDDEGQPSQRSEEHTSELQSRLHLVC